MAYGGVSVLRNSTFGTWILIGDAAARRSGRKRKRRRRASFVRISVSNKKKLYAMATGIPIFRANFAKK
jgi:hypothetical protein